MIIDNTATKRQIYLLMNVIFVKKTGAIKMIANRQTGIDAMEFIKKIPDKEWKKIDTIVWDPPYFDSDNKDHIEKFNKRANRFTRDITINAVLMNPIHRKNIKEYIENKINATWIKFHSVDNSYNDKYKMVWYKKKPSISGAVIYPNHEFIWISTFKKLNRCILPYVLDYPITMGKNQYGGNGYRTAQKPLLLFEQLFKKLDSKVILDPFAGYGNSIRAADKLGLEIWACDLDKKLSWDKITKLEDWL